MQCNDQTRSAPRFCIWAFVISDIQQDISTILPENNAILYSDDLVFFVPSQTTFFQYFKLIIF